MAPPLEQQLIDLQKKLSIAEAALAKSQAYSEILDESHRNMFPLYNDLAEKTRLLEASETRYELAVAAANEGIWDWDVVTQQAYFSPRCLTLLGLPNNTTPSINTCLELIHTAERDTLKNRFMEFIGDKERTSLEIQCKITLSDKSLRWISCRGLAKRDESGEVFRLAGSIADITKQKELENRLRDLSNLDGLTGVPNRRCFDEQLQTEWRRQSRQRENSLGLLLIDIDEFKRYNDNYGHQSGDRCLQKVAAAMQSCLSRAGDFLARYGGEEFVVILPQTDLEGAKVVAEKVRQSVLDLALAHEFTEQSHNLVSISLGLAIVDDTQSQSAAGLIKKADDALYKAKEAGRNCVIIAK